MGRKDFVSTDDYVCLLEELPGSNVYQVVGTFLFEVNWLGASLYFFI